MKKAFFFEIQQITDNILFDEFKKQTISFFYFQVDQKYYLFCYRQKSIDRIFLSQSVKVIQELNSKKRKIRSLKDFFLYALEIMENGKNYQSLNKNLQPFVCRKVKTIIRQNKKAALIKFLFPALELEVSNHSEDQIKNIKKIKNFETLLKSLQDKDQNGLNFITLGNLSEQEKTEIIERGFQLNQDGKISLKNYYQSRDQNSLFQFKRSQIKYETIRRTKIYSKLKS